MAIDRKAISDKLFEGKQPVPTAPSARSIRCTVPPRAQYAYDPAAAKKLLDEAGFATSGTACAPTPSGERLSIEITHHRRQPLREQVAQVIQSQLRQVGIELRLKAEPPRIFSEA